MGSPRRWSRSCRAKGGRWNRCSRKTSSFTNSLADNNQVIEQLIDELRTVLDTLVQRR